MLTSTFLHAPGVGQSTERKLWDAGIRDWDAFLAPGAQLPLGAAKRNIVAPVLEESQRRLETLDHRYFARILPAAEHWRATGEFSQQMAFLDIETTGTGSQSHPTVIGLYDFAEGEYRTWVYGENIGEFTDAVDEYKVLVTFYGAGFDLPVLRNWDPRIRFHQLHVDLCPLLRRLGYRGGLKRIERQLGIARPDEVEGMSGLDAVRLWWQWKRGDRAALETLIEYNREDVVNMVRLLQIASQKMMTASGWTAENPK
jgi:uncharacterized protein YprB with RNaseH-like and TPR domain